MHLLIEGGELRIGGCGEVAQGIDVQRGNDVARGTVSPTLPDTLSTSTPPGSCSVSLSSEASRPLR
jgi:hypothetical protein